MRRFDIADLLDKVQLVKLGLHPIEIRKKMVELILNVLVYKLV